MASKSKIVATGVTRHALSDGTFSFQADVDLKGYDRLEETFATLDDAKTWRAKKVAKFKSGKSGKYAAPEGAARPACRSGSCICRRSFASPATVGTSRLRARSSGPRFAALRELGLAGPSNKRDREIQPGEIGKIKPYLPAVMQDVVDALMIVPFRVGEPCGIEWKHFNEINRSVQLFRKDTSRTKVAYKKAVSVTLPVIEVVVDDETVVDVDTFDLLFNRGDRDQPGPFIVADRVSIDGQGVEASRLFSTAHTVAAQ